MAMIRVELTRLPGVQVDDYLLIDAPGRVAPAERWTYQPEAGRG